MVFILPINREHQPDKQEKENTAHEELPEIIIRKTHIMHHDNRSMSPESWRRLWAWKGEHYKTPEWVLNREIRVERTPGVDPKFVDAVISGVNSLLNDICLIGFKIRDLGVASDTIAEIMQATLQNGRLDDAALSKILENEEHRNPSKGGIPHADIVITDMVFNKHPTDWGETRFNPGTMIISVPRHRQRASDSLHNIARHEAAHLFGLGPHHKKLYSVTGYSEVEKCLMEYVCPTPIICDECKDALTSFWQGVEKQTGLEFLIKDYLGKD